MSHLVEAAHVRFGNRHETGLTGNLKVKPRLAHRTLPPHGMPLKDRFAFGLNAIGTQVMYGLLWVSLLMKAMRISIAAPANPDVSVGKGGKDQVLLNRL